MSSALVSPLETKRHKKRKRAQRSPILSDSDDAMLTQKPRKRLKHISHPSTCTTTQDAVNLCSSDSENGVGEVPADKKSSAAAVAATSMDECPFCDKSLRSLSPPRQELHINACLDSFDTKYACPVCNHDLTLFTDDTRQKHIKACLPDAKRNADDMEFDSDPFESIDAQRKQQKKRAAKIVVRDECKSLFERKFVCYLCEKSLNRHKLKGRCAHLKQCAKKQSRDVYAVCELLGIARNIVDCPQNYEEKFHAAVAKDTKNGKSKQTTTSTTTCAEIDDLSMFALNGPLMPHKNDALQTHKTNVCGEATDFLTRHQKGNKKRIALNDFDTYIRDAVRDLSEVNGIIQRLQTVRQSLELKLQRTRALKEQHTKEAQMEQAAILMSVSPKKRKSTDVDTSQWMLSTAANGAISTPEATTTSPSIPLSQKRYTKPIKLAPSDWIHDEGERNANCNLWQIAQKTHTLNASQFALSNVLPSIHEHDNHNHIHRSACKSTQSSVVSGVTECLLGGLLSDQDDESVSALLQSPCAQQTPRCATLISTFFNETLSCSEIADTDAAHIIDDRDAAGDITKSNNCSLHSIESNNGSLFGVDHVEADADNEGENDHSNYNYNSNSNPNSNQNACKYSPVVMERLETATVTPITQKRVLPETPMVCMTPMIGAEKEHLLKALNLYFETPLMQRRNTNVSAIALPPDIAGRQQYIGRLKEMSVDSLKKEMKKYGLKPATRLIMRQRLEMVFDAMHPNSPMNKALNAFMAKPSKHDDDGTCTTSADNKNSGDHKEKAVPAPALPEKVAKKSMREIHRDIVAAINRHDELLLKIATFQTVQWNELQALCKQNDIQISNKNMRTFLDEQGIAFTLPEDTNAYKGPRKVRRKRAKR